MLLMLAAVVNLGSYQLPLAPPIPPEPLPMFEAEPALSVTTDVKAICDGVPFKSSFYTSRSGVIFTKLSLGLRRANKSQILELNKMLTGFHGQVLTRVSCNRITAQIDFFEAKNLSNTGKYVGIIWTNHRLVRTPQSN